MTIARPNDLGLLDAVQRIRAGGLRSIDLVDACLARIAEREAVVGAWTYVDPVSARTAALECDRGPSRGPLHGIPFAVKDIIDTAGVPTEYGSSIYRGRIPTHDAACVTAAKRAGAIMLGKTVTTEFAYFSPGNTTNPWDPARTPGGSSSGTAAAVADRMVPAGFGTQTAASITRPASFCGVVGYKPSFGTFDLTGVKRFSESFDTLGTICRSARDAHYLQCALLGKQFNARSPAVPRRIGLCRTPWWTDADDDCRTVVEAAAERLRRAGVKVVDFELPTWFSVLIEVHRDIMAYEGARNYADEYADHHEQLSQELRVLINRGREISTNRYREACADAERARREFSTCMQAADLLIAPSAKGEAPIGLASTGDPLFSRMWTLLRVPSITIPRLSGAQGLPVGVQLITDIGDDWHLLRSARWVELALADVRSGLIVDN